MADTVLYLAWAPFFSGAERALVILLENLDPVRYRPVVVLGTSGELETELRGRGIATVHIPVRYRGVKTMLPWLGSVARIAQVWFLPDTRRVAPLTPVTGSGVTRSISVPSPSWPKSLSPQQCTAPPATMAQAWPSPTAIARAVSSRCTTPGSA